MGEAIRITELASGMHPNLGVVTNIFYFLENNAHKS